VDQYIGRRIFAPLGIARWEWPRSPAGEVMTGGGLRLTSRDLAKLAWLVTERGRWRGRQVIPASWVKAMTTERREADSSHGYGYLMWRATYASPCGSVKAWYMAGNGGNAIIALPSLDAAAVITRTAYNTRGMHQQTAELVQDFVLPALGCGPA
jgi:CubicO group peptidase (beta-lactamase class C family)